MDSYNPDPKVTIIGGGLSAIYSYWGCLDAGYSPLQVEVITANRQQLEGAIYLYESPIPWPVTDVVSILVGTCDGYAFNQWSDYSVITSAHKRFLNDEINIVVDQLFDPADLLPVLWSMIPRVHQLSYQSDRQIEELRKKRDAVICTFPDQAIRRQYSDAGWFTTIPIYSQKVDTTNHVIVYNGEPENPWVRQTLAPGRMYVEYPYGTQSDTILNYQMARGSVSMQVNKVQDLHPSCQPVPRNYVQHENLLRVGRMATGIRHYLSHQARMEVADFLESMQ